VRKNEVGPSFLQILDNLVASAVRSDRFADLMRKLATTPRAGKFLDAVVELTVVSRLVRCGAANVAVIPTSDCRSPDASAVLNGETVFFEVTRLTGVNARQRNHEDRVKALKRAIEAFPSPFDVTFIPGAEYEDSDVAGMADLIRQELIRIEAAGTLKPGNMETVVFPPPRFGLWVSFKAGKAARFATTKFRESSRLAFGSSEGYDQKKLRDKIVEKYGQCVAAALNVLIIQPAHDVLDDAARDLDLYFLENKRPHLTAAVVLSTWGGNSRVLRNPGADPAAPSWLSDALNQLAELDDEIWTSAGAPALGQRCASTGAS
jgi:hypothetical protein